MGKQHVPDEILMKQIEGKLKAGRLSVAHLAMTLSRHPANILRALYDLEHRGKAEQCGDGYQWQLVGSGHRPGPTGGEAA